MKNIQTEIIEKLVSVPGLVGLASLMGEDDPKPLVKKDWDKSLSVEETPQGLHIRAGIIIEVNSRAKIVVKESYSAIQNILKINEQKVNKILIYIRGVK